VAHPSKPDAVTFDEQRISYRFPILQRSGGKLYKQLFETRISEDKDILGRKLDKMIPTRSAISTALWSNTQRDNKSQGTLD
jgi:hypothetical protein